MNADDVRAAKNRCRDGRGRAEQTLARWNARTVRPREGFAEKRFPRCADHDRAGEPREFGEPREDFKILFVFFPESDPGIEQVGRAPGFS